MCHCHVDPLLAVADVMQTPVTSIAEKGTRTAVATFLVRRDQRMVLWLTHSRHPQALDSWNESIHARLTDTCLARAMLPYILDSYNPYMLDLR